MALTLSGTNGVVGAGFTVDASGVSVTAGVGTFSSIGAGASVPAAGLTGSLPTISAANCTNIPAANITGTLPAISGANLTNLPAGGITHASTWYLTSSFTGNAAPVTALSAYTGAGAGSIGSAMTISSGIFTFPTTGIWWIQVDCGFQLDGDSRYNRAEIRTTTNNSSYSYALAPYTFIDDSGSSGTIYSGQHTGHLFDVVDTSTHKCRIDVETVNSSTQTWILKVLFVRYGDT
tara:strand:- start:10 stop:711 length:702 start_codon:yes stop_codon:yes gene_type:complete